MFYNKYAIDNDRFLIMKVIEKQIFFLLQIIHTTNKNRNILFYEKGYEIHHINKLFKRKNNNNEEILKMLNKEIENNNIDFMKKDETRINIYFKNYKLNIELIGIDLYQKIKNHLKLFSKNKISDFNNPNFKYKKNIISNALTLIELYNPFDNQDEIFLIYQNNKSFNIELYNITLLKPITSIKNNLKLTIIKHFFNPKDSYDYLCTSDVNRIIYVYNLSLNYKLLYKIKSNYTFNIFSCLLFFDDKNNNNYLITSTYAKYGDNFTKAYILEEGAFIKNYPSTDENSTSALIYWFHKKLKCKYIIELCDEKIFIYSMITNGIYVQFDSKGNDFINGCIIENGEKDFLICSTYNNDIFIFDLYKKTLNNIINFWPNKDFNNRINDIIKWSNKYIIISDAYKNGIFVIDIMQNKIVSFIKESIAIHYLSMKKILHCYFGEILVGSCDDSTIKIFY